MNVYQKLQQARIKLQNTKLSKSGNNKFAGYQYFELSDFLPTVQAIFNEIGLCGAVYFTKEHALLNIVNCDKPDEVINFSSPMAEANLKGCHPIQNLGAVETYQRRYLWVTALEIVEHDILDATTGNDTPKSHKTVSRDVFDNMPTDMQNDLRNIAMEVISLLSKNDPVGAYDYIESQELDADLKTGLWSLLDSTHRTTLKKIATSRKAA